MVARKSGDGNWEADTVIAEAVAAVRHRRQTGCRGLADYSSSGVLSRRTAYPAPSASNLRFRFWLDAK